MKLKKPLKSNEAIFLANLFDSLPRPQHPLLSVLVGQISKLMVAIDSNEDYQRWARELLNRIKETWDADKDT